MKKLLTLILGLSLVLVFSCANGSDGEGGSKSDPLISYTFPEDNYYYTIPEDCQLLKIPAKYNGKNCFIIYSNLTDGNIDKSKDVVKNENPEKARTVISAEPEMKILEHAFNYADGTYRDEIQFEKNPILRSKKKNSISREAGEPEDPADPPEPQRPIYRAADDADFWVQTSDGKWTKETFTLKYDSAQHCRIWYYNNNSAVVDDSVFTDEEFKKLADTIDNAFAIETAVFGSNAYDGAGECIDATEDTKLNVLIYDLLGDATSSQRGGVFGFFRPYDFNSNDYIDIYNQKNNKNLAKNSNECEVIHIDAYFLQKDIQGYKKTKDDGTQEIVQAHKVESTLIHEFQHLLNLCNKYEQYSTWFTEMLAMSAEEVLQETIDTSDDDSPKSRFDLYFDRPYQGFINWPKSQTEDVYYAYSNAYAFGAYLMRNFGGIKLIHEIATNKKENGEPYSDGEAITHALHECGFTDESYESVLQKFGMTHIFSTVFDSEKITLSKWVVETFKKPDSLYGSYVLCLDSIYLNEYYFPLYKSKAEMQNDINNNLYFEDGRYKYVYWNSGEHAIMGPRIFRSNYKLPEAIQASGFAVYHAGEIASNTSFRVKKSSEITMTAVIK